MANTSHEQKAYQPNAELVPQNFSLKDLQQILGIQGDIQGTSYTPYGDGSRIVIGTSRGKSALAINWYDHVYNTSEDTLLPKSSPALIIEGGTLDMSGQLGGLYHKENRVTRVIDRVTSIMLTEDGILFQGTVGVDNASIRLYTGNTKVTYETWEAENPGAIPNQEEEVRRLEGKRLTIPEIEERIRRVL